MNKTILRIGNIGTSCGYSSFEIRPLPKGQRWYLSFGPTYNGTRWGMVAALGVGVVLAHIR